MFNQMNFDSFYIYVVKQMAFIRGYDKIMSICYELCGHQNIIVEQNLLD